MRTLNGGWSYSWQGDRADDEALTGEYNTILEALVAEYGANNVRYEAGVSYATGAGTQWWEENTPEIAQAVRAAAGVDVIVACVGENSYCETPGNITDLNLSQNQTELVKALAKTGKPIILVLNEGRPRIVREITPLADAIVNVMLPSNYGGDALARLMVGKANFSGRLPFTYPRHINSVLMYDHKPAENLGQIGGNYIESGVMDVEWEFGTGLSYTTFAYSNLSAAQTQFTAKDELQISVDVTNTGNVAGKESVLLYASDLVASMTPDVKRLREFQKVELQPGETKSVTFTLPASDLAFVGYDKRWILEAGEFKLMCGDQELLITCTETKKWETPNI